MRIGIGNALARIACTEAPPDVVAEVNITGLSPASTVILNINGSAIEIGEDTVVIHGSSVIANIEDALAVTGILTSADQRCIIDSGFGKRSFGIIVDVSIVFAGIPTVTYGAGPRDPEDAHGHRADERITLDDLRRATRIIAAALVELLPAGARNAGRKS